jgi:HEAT repeat protein
MLTNACWRLLTAVVVGAGLAAQGPVPAASGAANPYALAPFHADFPVELEYPARRGLGYDRTRRQMLTRVVANLQGNTSQRAWQMAMDFFWRAPEDAGELLIEAMDRSFGNPGLQDVVRNCVEAMGKMADERFDAALQRALEHKNAAVRQAALTALGTSGKVATVRGLYQHFPQMDARARTAWLRAARTRLGADAVPMLTELMQANYHASVRDQVLKETLELPPALAAEVLRGRFPEALDEFKAIIAGVLHAAGDTAGSVWLREALRGEDLAMLPLAIRHSAFGDPGLLREDLLRLSSHVRADIRYELARVLTRLEGNDIAEVFEVLSADEAGEVRSVALRELTRRGRPQAVGALIEELTTATGSRVQGLLNLIAASGDERGTALFAERFRKAPVGEGRPFLQALGVSQSASGARALLEIFLGPEIAIAPASGPNPAQTTMSYIPLMLLNVRGGEAAVFETFEALPREDWRRRALLVTTISGLAADRQDQALVQRCVDCVRTVLFDRSELPQLRLLALNLLTRRWLRVEDALRLASSAFEESDAMRALLSDFLHEYF